jgi:hypothetical protein
MPEKRGRQLRCVRGKMSFVRAGPCETLPLRSQYPLMSQISGYRSRKRYGNQKQEKPLAISGQVTGNARGGATRRTVIPAIQNCRACAQSFVVKLCALSVFRKADGISGPAQKNNPKAVVLIERARRIKFDDSERHQLRDAAGFCRQLAKTGSPY